LILKEAILIIKVKLSNPFLTQTSTEQ